MKTLAAILLLVLFNSIDARSLQNNKLSDLKLEWPDLNGQLTVKRNSIEGKVSLSENGDDLNLSLLEKNGKDFTGEASWNNENVGVDATVVSENGEIDGILNLKGQIPVERSVVNLEGAVNVAKHGIKGYNAKVDVDVPQMPWLTSGNIEASIGVEEGNIDYEAGVKTKNVEAQLMRDGNGHLTYNGVVKNQQNSVKVNGDFEGHVKYEGNAKLGDIKGKVTGDENIKNIKYKIDYDQPAVHAVVNGDYSGKMNYDVLLNSQNSNIDVKGDSKGNVEFDAAADLIYANLDVKGKNKNIGSWEAHSGVGVQKNLNGYSIVRQDMVQHGVKNLGGSIDIGVGGDAGNAQQYLGSLWLGPVGAKVVYDKVSQKPKFVGLLNVDEVVKGSVDIESEKIERFDGSVNYKNLNILNTNVKVNANVNGDENGNIIGKGDIKFHDNDIKLNLETKKNNYYHIAGSFGNTKNAVDLAADTNGVYKVGLKINGQRYGFQL